MSFSEVNLPAADRTSPFLGGKRTGRILVVDDERAIVDVIVRALEAYDVTVAESCLVARSLCESQSFDAILCDVTMRDFDGIDLWESLRARGTGFERRIAFMTGGTFTRRARDFLSQVPNRCLYKPFPIATLESLVESLMSESPR